MRIVISLLNEPELLPLALIEPGFDAVGLLEPLQRQDQQLRVVLVGEWREGDGREAPRLQPVDGGGVDGDRLLGGDVGTVLQVVVLPLLLSLQVQPDHLANIRRDQKRFLFERDCITRWIWLLRTCMVSTSH